MTPTDLAWNAEREIVQFEQWFMALPNEALSKGEIAILRTFLYWQDHARRAQASQEPQPSANEPPAGAGG
jgi:hypothetical protein